VAEWADVHRTLPRGSAEPGRWRTARTPYLVDPMAAITDPRYRRIVLVTGAQMGKSEALLNAAGHRLHVDPAPVIYVAATQRQVESISTGRFMPMIRSTPPLLERLDQSRTTNKVTERFFAGQRVGFAWAGSATELSSHPVALAIVDEVDRFEDTSEGDPVALVEARTATYPGGKVVIASTPTLEGGSRIVTLWEGGTRHRWQWPCPDCNECFAPSLDLLKWPEKASPSVAKREARLACPHCGSLIADRHRGGMNAKGRYVAEGDLDSDTASFWVSGICSPWRSFGDCARAWVEAVRSGDSGRMQATKNTVFGEVWQLRGEAPPPEAIDKLRAAYATDETPAGVQVVTCGVDVQKDRIYLTVRGWGERASSWLLRHEEIWGDTDQPEVWNLLGERLDLAWNGKKIRLMLVDAGYRPDRVYEFVRRFPGRAQASRGHDRREKPVSVSRLEVNARGESLRYGIQVVQLDVGYLKSWLHGRFVWPIDKPGHWLIPHDASLDYCEQLLSESRVVKSDGRVVWIRAKKANHFLDCEVYAAGAATLLGLHGLRAPKATTPPPAKPVDPQDPANRPWPGQHPGFARPKRNWVKSW
jgi:phage terminase large subunit GpA-like protein